jgi:hypothetical protein
MKKVRINYDISSDIIACPNHIAENFDDYIGGIYEWIRENPEAKEYKMVDEDGDIGYYIDTQVVLKYLNTMVIKEVEEKAYLVKHKASWFERPKYHIDF